MRLQSLLIASFLMALPAAAAPGGVVVTDAAGRAGTVTAAALAKLPQTRLAVSFTTAHGILKASFSGPLLWAVLAAGQAVDPRKSGPAVREALIVTGADGYTAVLALGELAPFLENKQVILAEAMNGRPLGPTHLRVVVPGDGHGARSVRDVVGLAISKPR